jgi:hypothetical protein
MLRWTRGGFLERPDLAPIAALFCLQFFSCILALSGHTPGILAWAAFANFGILFLFVVCTFEKIRSKERSFLFPAYYAALFAETIALLVAFIASPSISWKNRKL